MDTATLFIVIQLPGWPPPESSRILQTKLATSVIELSGEPDASFRFRSTDHSGTQVFHFARAQFDGPPNVVLSLTWDGRSPKLRLNRLEIPVVPPDVEPPTISLVTKQNPLAPIPALTRDVPPSATPAEALLVRSLHDLYVRSGSPDWYELLRASGILRQLLLDGLLHRANAEVKAKIAFCTNDFRDASPLSPVAHWQNLSPEPLATRTLLELTLDEFLKAPSLNFNGRSATVRDVIRACANASGGVHFGPARDPGEEVVLEFDDCFATLGLAPSLAGLHGLCRITVRALLPLLTQIQLRPS